MVEVKQGDLVRMEYTGKVASTGIIFDTTSEETAKKAGIFDPSAQYGAKLTVFGAASMVEGMEEAIVTSKLGQTEEFTIPSEKAFGSRRPDFVRMLPEKEFLRQQVRPEIGMVISLDGALAKVKSITSGRVVVDYNHPLAGESVTYSLKVTEIISAPKKKAEAVLASLGLSASSKVLETGGKLKIEIGKGADAKKADMARKTILALVPGTEFASA